MEDPKSNKAEPLGHVAIHETVGRIMSSLEAGTVLDIPAGEGALSERLAAIGWDVVCADLYPEIFKLDGTGAVKADLDSRLPFGDSQFDAVVCVEGLEHIEHPANAVREFARIVRPGGRLVISVPNILNIEERLKWLIHGYTSHFKPVSRPVLEEVARTYGERGGIALHINPIGYSEIRYLLEQSGFAIRRLYRDKPKKDWAYRPLTAIIRLVGRLTPESKRASRWTEELNSDEVLLGGNTLIFEAVRKDG